MREISLCARMWKRAYRETTKRNARIQRNACTHTRTRRDEPLPLVLVDQYTMLVEARWEEEAEGHGRKGKREEALLKPWTHWTDICTMRSPESRVAVFGISSLIHLVPQIIIEISNAYAISGVRPPVRGKRSSSLRYMQIFVRMFLRWSKMFAIAT